jgi:hypothetical protein
MSLYSLLTENEDVWNFLLVLWNLFRILMNQLPFLGLNHQLGFLFWRFWPTLGGDAKKPGYVCRQHHGSQFCHILLPWSRQTIFLPVIWSFLKSHVYYLPRLEIIMLGHQRQTCTRLFIPVCSNRMWSFLPARHLQSHNFMFGWFAMAVVVNWSLGAVTLTSTV